MVSYINYANKEPSMVMPLGSIFPAPIVAKRPPTVGDVNYPIGQLWVYTSVDFAYQLTSKTAGVATWTIIT